MYDLRHPGLVWLLGHERRLLGSQQRVPVVQVRVRVSFSPDYFWEHSGLVWRLGHKQRLLGPDYFRTPLHISVHLHTRLLGHNFTGS
jgi:hypothetical protein